MVVHHLDMMGVGAGPLKTESELVVDATALSFPVALQRFKVVCGRDAKIFKTRRCVQPRQPAALARFPEPLQIGILEALNHEPILTCTVHNVTHYLVGHLPTRSATPLKPKEGLNGPPALLAPNTSF
jgi:hypothetical protein